MASHQPKGRPHEGYFITFEGIDGAGKSSHIQATVEWCSRLIQYPRELVVTREPGGTPLSEKLRHILLSDEMCLETEALLMFAARQEHVTRVIQPALDRGDWVVCDRFTDSSYAYQCGGRNLPRAKLLQLETWVHGNLQPDLTFLFDLPVQVAAPRVKQRADLDRFERERADFHVNVRQAYLERAEASGDRFVIIDANRTMQEIWLDVEATLTSRIIP